MTKKIKKIKVELIPERNSDIKNKKENSSEISADKTRNDSDSEKPKKKWKKADYLANNKMPPPNKLIPFIVLLALLFGVYTMFTTLIFPANAEFDKDPTSKTGWQYHVAELKKENERQQRQLNDLNRKIKIHDSIITEQGKKIDEQSGKIEKNKQELDKVTKDLENYENKTEEQLKDLLKRQKDLRNNIERDQNELRKLKETDKLLRNDVNQLKQQTQDLEDRFNKLSGDLHRGERERKEMKKDIQGLKERFDYLQEYLKQQGLEVPEFEDPEFNNQQ